MDKVHVLHVVGKMHRGGIETLLMCIYRRIDRSKIQFDFLVSTKDPGYYDNEIKELGGQILYAPSRRENPFTYKRKLYELLKTHDEIDAIQIHLSSCSFIEPLIIAKKVGIKYRIAHAHNTECEGKLRKIVHVINRYRLKKCATNYFACSKDAGKWMFNLQHENGFLVVNNGIEVENYIYDLKKRLSMRNKLNIGDSYVIGFVGRFETQKNPMFICETFYELKKELPNVKLLLVGEGSMHEEMAQYLKGKDILDSIIFTGVVTNVEDYLQAMDCFILPSLFEGLGIVAIEAQASGLPCYLSDAIPQEVKITDLVHFLPIENGCKIWKEEIISQLKNKFERKNMYDEIVEADYDISHTAHKLEKFYLEMRGNRE